MNWLLLILFGFAFFGFYLYMLYGRRRHKQAPNVLARDGWPRPENRNGTRPNDEE